MPAQVSTTNTKKPHALEENLSTLTKNISQTEPDLKAMHKAQELGTVLQGFAGVVTKFSLFEILMSGVGMLTTKFDSDWSAYFAESIIEYAENSLLAGKQIQSKEKVIGALNIVTASGSILNTIYQTIKNFTTKKLDEKKSSNPIVALVTQAVLPLVNASLMWASGTGKRYTANAIQELIPKHYDRQEVNGAMTSGNQDYICGTSSALLMVRQAIEKINPTLGHILEPVFAMYISIQSLREGFKAVKGEEEHEDASAKYQLANWEHGFIGNTLYRLAKTSAGYLGVKLPDVKQLFA